LAQDLATATFRHLMTAAGGALLSEGLLSKANEATFVQDGVATLMIVAGVAWSYVQKHWSRQAIVNANKGA
jgi:hypothetical protein